MFIGVVVSTVKVQENVLAFPHSSIRDMLTAWTPSLRFEEG